MSVTGDPRRDEDVVREGLENPEFLYGIPDYRVSAVEALDRLVARVQTLECENEQAREKRCDFGHENLSPYWKQRAETAEARVHTLEQALAGGAGLIAAERTRQVAAEGWSAGHDDAHDDGALALAAATYALPRNIRDLDTLPRDTAQRKPLWLCLWPWNQKWWKPTPDDRVRELAKAGALIAAEIDRLARAVVLEGREHDKQQEQDSGVGQSPPCESSGGES